MSNSYVTTQEFTASKPGVLYANLQPPELQNYINRASAWIEHYCQRVFALQASITETLLSSQQGRAIVDSAGNLLIKPRQGYPINTVSSITWRVRSSVLLSQIGQSTSTTTTVNNNDVVIQTDTWGDGYAIYVIEDFSAYRDPSLVVQFTVTYSAGYTSYPDWLQEACIRATAAALRRRGASAVAAGSGAGLPLDMSTLGGDLDAARELLNPHKRWF